MFRLAVYYFIFTYVFEQTQEHFGLFIFSGLILWMFFNELTKHSMRVFHSKKYLLESIQVDKLDLFKAQSIANFLAFCFSLLAFLIISVVVGIGYTWSVLWLPLICLQLAVFAFSVGLILAIIKLYLNDIEHLWDMMLLLGFWTAGIFFTAEQLMKIAPGIEYVHPVIGMIDNMRRVCIYESSVNMDFFIMNSVQVLVVLGFALFLFRRFEHEVIERL